MADTDKIKVPTDTKQSLELAEPELASKEIDEQTGKGVDRAYELKSELSKLSSNIYALLRCTVDQF